MKQRITTALAAVLAIGLIAVPSALAQGECPASMQPGGLAYGGLQETITLGVEVTNGFPNPLTNGTHGAVHWEVTGSYIYVAPEAPYMPAEAKRAYNTLSEQFPVLNNATLRWSVEASVKYRVWGPGTSWPPYNMGYDPECRRAAYTPYENGLGPAHFGESRKLIG